MQVASEMPAPGRITAIEPQKKRPSRVSLFIDEAFAFGLDREIQEKFSLRVGDNISREKIEKLLCEEEFKGACSCAFRFLAARPRSRQELANRLAEYQYPGVLIERTLEKCTRLGYIDDRLFARQYAESLLRQKSVGPRWLRERLRQLGVAEQISEDAISEVYKNVDEHDLARRLAEKRLSRLKDLPTPRAKSRLAAFLQRKGFSWEVINATVSHFFQ